jgi:hypothetical protein
VRKGNGALMTGYDDLPVTSPPVMVRRALGKAR